MVCGHHGCNRHSIGPMIIVQRWIDVTVALNCVAQMAELREENSLLRKQRDSSQNIIDGDTEPELAGKIDKNANLRISHSPDELAASDANQLQNIEAAQQQVMILFWMLEWRVSCIFFGAFVISALSMVVFYNDLCYRTAQPGACWWWACSMMATNHDGHKPWRPQGIPWWPQQWKREKLMAHF